MKKLDSITFVLLFAAGLFSLMAFTSIKRAYRTPVVSVIDKAPIQQIKVDLKIDTPKIEINLKDHKAFLDAIGHKESGNRYDVVNRYGYMGRYQFGKATLKTLRIKVSKAEFLTNSELQEEAMFKLLTYNKKRLQKYIDKYEGDVVNGILVTESGLLAAAHLGGAGSVKKWFRNGKVRRDGNGVKITSYMTKFSGYQLDLN
jgi:soluble lytic murein transglycosylase-like protein